MGEGHSAARQYQGAVENHVITRERNRSAREGPDAMIMFCPRPSAICTLLGVGKRRTCTDRPIPNRPVRVIVPFAAPADRPIAIARLA